MNIYVETNFVLELTFEQEQWSSCEQILQLCEASQAELIIPAYSLTEPYEKLTRQSRNRKTLQLQLDAELSQLSRTASYTNLVKSIKEDIASLMVQSNEEERLRFDRYRQRILSIGDVIALTADILSEAALCETQYGLASQDALVFASVVSHLRNDKPHRSCFLNRNSKDFGSPDVVDQLNQFNCRVILSFENGYEFIRSQL
mgnify:CR=1 FL=1